MTVDKTEPRGFVKVSTPNFEPSERWRIIRNILAISCAFMMNFIAFMGASNLQSSVNADQSLGTFTLSAIYGSLLFSNIFLPALVISWLGCKWTMSVSILAYMPFIAAQFYPKFYTMIPAGLSVGLGGGPLWCAKCTYLTVVAEAYSTVSDIAANVLVTRFFGLFFMFYQMAQVWGNLISSAVLSYGIETVTRNVTLNNSIVAEKCGANFCGVSDIDQNPNLQRPSVERIYLIAGIYLGCMILACLIIAFGVDSLSRYDRNRTSTVKGTSGFKLLASFVSCAKGISNVGYVMICFGVTNAIAALATGSIVKLTGRKPVMIFAFCLHLSLFFFMLRWKPTPEQGIIFFLVSGLWGVCDSIWLVQVNALSGILFPGQEEAAFSNFRLWESTGSVITYIYSPYLCTFTKLYLLIGILCVGMIGYGIIEWSGKINRVISNDKPDFELVNRTD
ncbi:UNC93-like protein [Camponotus floridanus]|uniref:UNC93-like protein n=1 Tax=Camponotus floridanus TaxID=104421 RepID=E2AUR7_CAMFO|nr:UNC93-like protein [Camponotus floridanus]